MSIDPKVESTRKLLAGGVSVEASFPSAGDNPIATLTRFLDRRMARGTCTPISGGKRWTLEHLSIDLVDEGGTISVSAKEDWAPQLQGAVLTGLGYGFGLALLFALLPLWIPLAPIMVGLGLTNLVSDVAIVAWAIKLAVGVSAVVVMTRRQHRAVYEGLGYRRDELRTTVAKLAEVLDGRSDG
jgi:hypothetical protein